MVWARQAKLVHRVSTQTNMHAAKDLPKLGLKERVNIKHYSKFSEYSRLGPRWEEPYAVTKRR